MSNTSMKTNFRYAGLIQRVSAFVFDFLIIGAYILILLGVGFGLYAITGGTPSLHTPFTVNVIAFVTTVLPVVLYFTLQEGSHHQATWGKRKMKIKVVNAQGAKVSWGQALARSAIKFLPWQIAHMCITQIWLGDQSLILLVGSLAAQGLVLLYIVSLWLNKKHQALYDWIAGTFVISVE